MTLGSLGHVGLRHKWVGLGPNSTVAAKTWVLFSRRFLLRGGHDWLLGFRPGAHEHLVWVRVRTFLLLGDILPGLNTLDHLELSILTNLNVRLHSKVNVLVLELICLDL